MLRTDVEQRIIFEGKELIVPPLKKRLPVAERIRINSQKPAMSQIIKFARANKHAIIDVLNPELRSQLCYYDD